MEAVRALIIILLAAAVELTAVVIYNNRTDPTYEAKIIQANKADTAEVRRQDAFGKMSAKASAPAAHHKNKSSNL